MPSTLINTACTALSTLAQLTERLSSLEAALGPDVRTADLQPGAINGTFLIEPVVEDGYAFAMASSSRLMGILMEEMVHLGSPCDIRPTAKQAVGEIATLRSHAHTNPVNAEDRRAAVNGVPLERFHQQASVVVRLPQRRLM